MGQIAESQAYISIEQLTVIVLTLCAKIHLGEYSIDKCDAIFCAYGSCYVALAIFINPTHKVYKFDVTELNFVKLESYLLYLFMAPKSNFFETPFNYSLPYFLDI